MNALLQRLWRVTDFKPNEQQAAAILHTNGPLYLPAGPGSGKTRVLLWRTVNLIVCHGVSPEAIYLSTFTEKAAFQLKEGLRVLLGIASNHTDRPYDISKMYVGTVHSLCQRLITDRRFYPNRQRGKAPVLLDDLGQFFYLHHTRMWNDLLSAVALGDDAHATINALFNERSESKFKAVTNCIALFNRLSEECVEPQADMDTVTDDTFRALLTMYARYRESLQPDDAPPRTDFSLLQQRALETLDRFDGAPHVFAHIIVDEYQDTNHIQERIFFRLARGHQNICVVGDDDQALYRFRGATVENFVEFPERCRTQLGVSPRKIPLVTNYRSRQRIVKFYTDFMARCDWRKQPRGAYRVADKAIQADSKDKGVSVIASTPAHPDDVSEEIATLVRQLLDSQRVADPNQIAFLFPSLKTEQVRRMKGALEAKGLRVYAPRAGRFLDEDEAVALFGIYLHVFGKPDRDEKYGGDYKEFHDWVDTAHATAQELMRADRQLAQYVKDRKAEVETATADYAILLKAVERKGRQLTAPYEISAMKRTLRDAAGLSDTAK
ncbi:MAG: ATP-dependent helicase, partial [Chloroflexota bacterium]